MGANPLPLKPNESGCHHCPLPRALVPSSPTKVSLEICRNCPARPHTKQIILTKKNLQLQIAHCHLFPPTTRVHYCKDCLRPLLASMPPLLHASCLDQPDLDPILITMLMQIMASS